tara:strand:+ start:39115 stop:39303 length:189 start_codon:yes stop_codon:yes gene_type:complete
VPFAGFPVEYVVILSGRDYAGDEFRQPSRDTQRKVMSHIDTIDTSLCSGESAFYWHICEDAQ